jgi:hypothetical protein
MLSRKSFIRSLCTSLPMFSAGRPISPAPFANSHAPPPGLIYPQSLFKQCTTTTGAMSLVNVIDSRSNPAKIHIAAFLFA